MTSEALFPADFIERTRRLLGAETEAFLAALAAPAAGLRVNTLRLPPARFEQISPFALTRLSYPRGGYLVDPGARPGKHPYHAAGLYYLQDPGAMTVAAALAPAPGERILDLAAAPGGKSTHLAALLGGTGLLVANDVQPVRARELAGNLERLGVRNAIVTCETPERLAGRFGASFDRVLLDAPCSGESMFAKSEPARRQWSDAAVLGCARRQAELLDSAARLVRPGGTLVYSTCTFSPAENEATVSAFVRAHPEFEIVSLEAPPGARQGRADWVAGSPAGIERTVRLWPHLVPGAGHFIAALRRRSGGETADPGDWTPRAPNEALALLSDFLASRPVGGFTAGERVALAGSELYAVPPGAPPMDGLRVVRPGWRLGTPMKGRFEPAHALALGVRVEDAADPVLLSSDDPRTSAYLRGEAITAPGEAGWTLVAVDGFPLGWGKRVGPTVKNHYPKGLRWR